ncbi:hypothetical protein [Polyangium jinanense]|uniref:Lipoprotein n=1 Tax=Polyangium jinanense TaxID=2829994 RepID=A0A9X4AV09_9BACT|nr:hypothetical protein [Polyangium jinanense]MDC3959932.1 hypothetical protein [Polyangium jinanense]MDC3983812.1 hypothetical protein [Polyangium jinanense]
MTAMISTRPWFLACLLSLFTVACGPPWTVVAKAVPNPFVNQRSFAVEPVHFEGVRIGEKSEAEYQASKDAEQQSSWDEDKRAFASEFGRELTEELPEVQFVSVPAPSPFVVRPVVTFIEPGFYAYVAARPSEVRMTLEIWGPGPQRLDVLEFRAVVPATMTNPSSGGRLRSAGEVLGAQVAEYLRTRVFP